MSEEIANAIILLLNAGADPQALKQATDPIEDLTFIPVEDLPKQEVLH